MSKSKKGKLSNTTVWLRPNTTKDGQNDKTLFYCYKCRTPIVEYWGHVASIVPGNSPYNMGAEIKCKGSFKNSDGDWQECGLYYIFQGVIYSE